MALGQWIAVALWALLAASFLLAGWGVRRRSGGWLLIAGAISILWCWAALLSVGRFALIIPLLELALGAAWKLRASRRLAWGICGLAIALYLGQLALL